MNEIARIRKQLELSQIEFGKLMGANQSTVSRWEAGKHVSVRTVLAARQLLASKSESEAAA